MNQPPLRIISAMLVVCFALQEISFAADSFHLPYNLGTVRSYGKATSTERIIHIQDAHDSLDAQKRITDILDVLTKDYDVKSIALEGSSGRIDPLLFKTYPDQDVARQVAQDLLKEGRLNAGEFFAVTNNRPVAVYGVEDRSLYRENLKVFKDVLKNKEKIDRDLRGLQKTLDVLAERIYSKPVQEIRRNKKLFEEGSLSFTKRWLESQQAANIANFDGSCRSEGYPNLRILSCLTKLENHINFSRANTEREKVLAYLQNQLKSDELNELLMKSVQFKAGKISDLEFHSYLLTAADGLSSPNVTDRMSPYRNLVRYTKYLKLFYKMDLAKVLDELDDFEERVKEAHFSSVDERILNKLEKNWKVLSAVVSGTATSKEFNVNIKCKDLTPWSLAVCRLAGKYHVPLYEGAKPEKILKVLPTAIRFYTLAEKRNAVMIGNTLKKMRAQHQEVAALVTGGFHTEGISHILKNENLSYLVVMPKITEANKKRPYITVLTRKRNEYEKTFSSPSSRFKIALGSFLDQAGAARGLDNLRLVVNRLTEHLLSDKKNAAARLANWLGAYEKGWRGDDSSPLNPKKIGAMMNGARLAEPTQMLKDWLGEDYAFVSERLKSQKPSYLERLSDLKEAIGKVRQHADRESRRLRRLSRVSQELLEYLDYLEGLEKSPYELKKPSTYGPFQKEKWDFADSWAAPDTGNLIHDQQHAILRALIDPVGGQPLLGDYIYHSRRMKKDKIYLPLSMKMGQAEAFAKEWPQVLKEEFEREGIRVPIGSKHLKLMKETFLLEFYDRYPQYLQTKFLNKDIHYQMRYMAERLYFDIRSLKRRMDGLRRMVLSGDSQETDFRVVLASFQYLRAVPHVVPACRQLEREIFETHGRRVHFHIFGFDSEQNHFEEAERALDRFHMKGEVILKQRALRELAPEDLRLTPEDLKCAPGDPRLERANRRLEADQILYYDPAKLIDSKDGFIATHKVSSAFKKILSRNGRLLVIVSKEKYDASPVFKKLVEDIGVRSEPVRFPKSPPGAEWTMANSSNIRLEFTTETLRQLNQMYDALQQRLDSGEKPVSTTAEKLKSLASQIRKGNFETEVAAADVEADVSGLRDSLREILPHLFLNMNKKTTIVCDGDYLFPTAHSDDSADIRLMMAEVFGGVLEFRKAVREAPRVKKIFGEIFEKYSVPFVGLNNEEAGMFVRAVNGDEKALGFIRTHPGCLETLKKWNFKADPEKAEEWERAFLKNTRLQKLAQEIKYPACKVLPANMNLKALNGLDEYWFLLAREGDPFSLGQVRRNSNKYSKGLRQLGFSVDPGDKNAVQWEKAFMKDPVLGIVYKLLRTHMKSMHRSTFAIYMHGAGNLLAEETNRYSEQTLDICETLDEDISAPNPDGSFKLKNIKDHPYLQGSLALMHDSIMKPLTDLDSGVMYRLNRQAKTGDEDEASAPCWIVNDSGPLVGGAVIGINASLMVMEPPDPDRGIEGGISIFRNERQALKRKLLEAGKNAIIGRPEAVEWHAGHVLSLENRLNELTREIVVPYETFKNTSLAMIDRLIDLAEQREELEYHRSVLKSSPDRKSEKILPHSARDLRKAIFEKPGTDDNDRDNSVRIAGMFLQNLLDDFYFETSEQETIQYIKKCLPGWAVRGPKWRPEVFAQHLTEALKNTLNLHTRILERKPGRKVEMEKYTMALGDLYRKSPLTGNISDDSLQVLVRDVPFVENIRDAILSPEDETVDQIVMSDRTKYNEHHLSSNNTMDSSRSLSALRKPARSRYHEVSKDTGFVLQMLPELEAKQRKRSDPAIQSEIDILRRDIVQIDTAWGIARQFIVNAESEGEMNPQLHQKARRRGKFNLPLTLRDFDREAERLTIIEADCGLPDFFTDSPLGVIRVFQNFRRQQAVAFTRLFMERIGQMGTAGRNILAACLYQAARWNHVCQEYASAYARLKRRIQSKTTPMDPESLKSRARVLNLRAQKVQIEEKPDTITEKETDQFELDIFQAERDRTLYEMTIQFTREDQLGGLVKAEEIRQFFFDLMKESLALEAKVLIPDLILRHRGQSQVADENMEVLERLSPKFNAEKFSKIAEEVRRIGKDAETVGVHFDRLGCHREAVDFYNQRDRFYEKIQEKIEEYLARKKPIPQKTRANLKKMARAFEPELVDFYLRQGSPEKFLMHLRRMLASPGVRGRQLAHLEEDIAHVFGRLKANAAPLQKPIWGKKMNDAIQLIQIYRARPAAARLSTPSKENIKSLIQLTPAVERNVRGQFAFSPEDFKAIEEWLSPTYPELLPSAVLLKKLWNYLYWKYSIKGKDAKNNIDEWVKILSKKWDVHGKNILRLLDWFLVFRVNVSKASNPTFSRFFGIFLSQYRGSTPFRPFFYFLPVQMPSEGKLFFAISNVQTMLRYFGANFLAGRSILKAPIQGTPYYLAMRSGFAEGSFGVSFLLGKETNNSGKPMDGIFFRIGVDTQGTDLRVITLKGYNGKQELINHLFPEALGLGTGRALLHVAQAFAEQHDFRNLVGIKGDLHPSLGNSKEPLGYDAIFKGFGLRRERKKGPFVGPWRPVSELRQRLRDQLAKNDLTAKGIQKMREAFDALKEIRIDGARLARQNAAEPSAGSRLSNTSKILPLGSATILEMYKDVVHEFKSVTTLVNGYFELHLMRLPAAVVEENGFASIGFTSTGSHPTAEEILKWAGQNRDLLNQAPELLANILGKLPDMLEKDRKSEIEAIQRQVEDGNRLLNDILHISKEEPKRFVDICETIQAVANSQPRHEAYKNVQKPFQLNLDSHALRVYGDAGELREVLINLLRNAAHAMVEPHVAVFFELGLDERKDLIRQINEVGSDFSNLRSLDSRKKEILIFLLENDGYQKLDAVLAQLYEIPEEKRLAISGFLRETIPSGQLPSIEESQPWGQISIDAHESDGKITIRVKDTGFGIQPGKENKVWDRTFTEKHGPIQGTGLGLPICQWIAELHGGEITLESKHISQYPRDHGTAFTINLPSADNYLLDLPNERLNISSGDARKTLSVLDLIPWRFEWKVQDETGMEKPILNGFQPGLKGFMGDFRKIRRMGPIGKASLQHHAFRAGTRGDIITHLHNLFKKLMENRSSLSDGVLKFLTDVERRINLVSFQETTDTVTGDLNQRDKVQYDLKAIAIAEWFISCLEETARGARLASDSAVAEPPAVNPEKSWQETHVPELNGKVILEVTAEMAGSGHFFDKLWEAMATQVVVHKLKHEMRKVAMAFSVGGIGPLLKERIIAMSELGADVVGVSLLYDKVWVQKIRRDGTFYLEKEKLTKHLRGAENLPGILEYAGELSIKMYDDKEGEVKVKVWKAPAESYGRAGVYFLDIPHNLTNKVTDTIGGRADVVYPGQEDFKEQANSRPGKKRTKQAQRNVEEEKRKAREAELKARLDQSWILGRGALALMKQLNKRPDIINMSEASSMMAHPKVFQDELSNDPFFKDSITIFNDHTPLDYAHPLWTEEVLKFFGRVAERFYKKLPVFLTDEKESDPKKKRKLDMTTVMVNGSDAVYGVAKKHGVVMRAMKILRPFAKKIRSITNGVSAGYWPQNAFKDLNHVKSMSDQQLLDTRTKERNDLIEWIAERQHLGKQWARKIIAGKHPIGIWTRRIVRYKRLQRFTEVLEDDAMRKEFLETGIVLIVGGRTHQDDPYGKQQFERIQKAIKQHPELKERVIFFENYNVWEAPRLFRGSDFSIMLSDDGREASATGFQKIQMNGGLVLGSPDGAVPESVAYYEDEANRAKSNGFRVEYQPIIDEEGRDIGSPLALDFLNALKAFSRVYHESDQKFYARMIRNALLAAPRVNVTRTAKKMLIFFGSLLKKAEKERENSKRIAEFAETVTRGLLFSKQEAQSLLTVADKGSSDFYWKDCYVKKNDQGQETPVTEVIIRNEPGLKGFVNGFEYVRGIGTVGQRSLAYHAGNRDGEGDILYHLADLVALWLRLGSSFLKNDGESVRSLTTMREFFLKFGEKEFLQIGSLQTAKLKLKALKPGPEFITQLGEVQQIINALGVDTVLEETQKALKKELASLNPSEDLNLHVRFAAEKMDTLAMEVKIQRDRKAMAIAQSFLSRVEAAARLTAVDPIAKDIRENGAVIFEWNAREKRKQFEEITDDEMRALKDRGFNVLWMMGIWKTSPFSQKFNEMWGKGRVASAYSIWDYEINPDLGDEASFKRFVARANKMGLKIIVDFVPNHMAADSPWVREHPEWFVNIMGDYQHPVVEKLDEYLIGDEKFNQQWLGTREYFTVETSKGCKVKVAHGRDPDSLPWIDTAQCDLSHPGLQEKFKSTLDRILDLTNGGGVRVDMAHLTLKDEFQKNWPRQSKMSDEFWPEAIRFLKSKYKDAIFVGEAYHQLEGPLQKLGFSYTYDKYIYDALVPKKISIRELVEYLERMFREFHRYLISTLHFLENHDDPGGKRMMKEMLDQNEQNLDLARRRQMAAMMVITTAVPGALLIHNGQMDGRSHEHPTANYLTQDSSGETHDAILSAFYRKNLPKVKTPLFRLGGGAVLKIPNLAPDVIVVRRYLEDTHGLKQALVIVNYGPSDASFKHKPDAYDWRVEPGLEGEWNWENIESGGHQSFDEEFDFTLAPWDYRVFLLKAKEPMLRAGEHIFILPKSIANPDVDSNAARLAAVPAGSPESEAKLDLKYASLKPAKVGSLKDSEVFGDSELFYPAAYPLVEYDGGRKLMDNIRRKVLKPLERIFKKRGLKVEQYLSISDEKLLHSTVARMIALVPTREVQEGIATTLRRIERSGAMNNVRPYQLDFRGVYLGGNVCFAAGYTDNDSLTRMRDALGKVRVKRADVIHATLFRFIQEPPPDVYNEIKALIEGLHKIPLGTVQVDKVKLISQTGPDAHRAKVSVRKEYKLGIFESLQAYREFAQGVIDRLAVWIQPKGSSSIDVHEVNAHPDADTLQPASVEDLGAFRRRGAVHRRYRAKANRLIAEGGLIKEFYFSGHGGGAMGVTTGRFKYAFMPQNGRSISGAPIMSIPLGIRDIIQYRAQLEKAAREYDNDPQIYLKNAKLILHVNEVNRDSIERDLKEFDWFGFSPENIVLLVQPVHSAYKKIDNKFFPQSTIKRLGGHGYTLTQTARLEIGEAYTFSPEGERKPLAVSAVDYFRGRGARWMLSADVNDLTQMTTASLDLDRLAMVLYLANRGHRVVMEMVENPDHRTGAYWVRDKLGRSFVVHTLELLSGKFKRSRALERLIRKGVLYGGFAHYFELNEFDRVLSGNNLPLYLEEESESDAYRLESFSDDVSRMPNVSTAAFHENGQATHTFRSDEDLPEVFVFMARQDLDPAFRAIVKEVYLRRAAKHLSEPIVFHTNWVHSVWGGTHIGELKSIPQPDQKVGETWEVSAQHRNPSHLVLGGQLQPLTLEDLMKDDATARRLVGERVFQIAGNWFPILYKFLDAAQILSVQVHPNTRVAEELGEGEPGKSEIWVVLGAKPGAKIYAGLKPGVTREELETAVRNNTDPLSLMVGYDVKPGDVLGNAPGVIHAIGAGVFVAEIQGNSDVTYRIYDHDRKNDQGEPRVLHAPQALKAIDVDLSTRCPIRRLPQIKQRTRLGSTIELLADDSFIVARRVKVKLHDKIAVTSNGDFQIVSVLKGRVRIRRGKSPTLIRQGQSVLMAASAEPIDLITHDHEAEVLFVSAGKAPIPVKKVKPLQPVQPTNVTGTVNLAMSVGGTKLAFGAVSLRGLIAGTQSAQIQWRILLKKITPEAFIELIVDELEKIVKKLERKGIGRNRIGEVGVAWPGPGNYAKGVVSATFIPGFREYPFGDKLSRRLKDRLRMNVKINVILDAWADAYGEMAENPLLKNWMYLNIATGVAVGIVRERKIIDAWPDKGIVSGFGQIGRHLIRHPNGEWEYRPTSNGSIPFIKSTETRLTNWVGGPALAARFIERVLKEAATTSVVPDIFFGTSVGALRRAVDKSDADAIKRVLVKVEENAKAQDSLAVKMISETGRDIGLALKAFADALPGEFFYNRIILGGGIGEHLGKDIPEIKSAADILLSAIIRSSGIVNIRRSTMNYQRELLAFIPNKGARLARETVKCLPIELLLFDMDDTLYNAPRLLALYKDALYELYRSHHGGTIEEARSMVENKRRELVSIGKSSGDADTAEALGFTFEETIINRQRIIGDESSYVEPVPGLRERLLELKSRYRLVVATNNVRNNAQPILEKLGIDDIFEKVYTQDETLLRKPNRRLFELIRSDFAVPFDRMMSIGDRIDADIEPAQCLGMKTLHVRNPEDLMLKIGPAIERANEEKLTIPDSFAVTGGSGDIGSALVKRLDESAPSLRVLVRGEGSLEAYARRSGSKLREARYLIADLMDRTKIEQTMKDHNVFYHMAAMLGLGPEPAIMARDVAVNGFLPIRLVRSAERVHPDIRFVFASSWVIYPVYENNLAVQWLDNALEFVWKNNERIDNAKNEDELAGIAAELLKETPLPKGVPAYAASKALVERYLAEKSALTNYVAVRISNSYGAGGLAGRTVQRLIEGRMDGRTTSIHQQSRDYIDVKDLAEIFYQAGVQPGIRRLVMDAASGTIVSPHDIWVAIVKRTLGMTGSVEFKGQPSAQKPQDARWSRKLLGREFISFEEGIGKQISWMIGAARLAILILIPNYEFFKEWADLDGRHALTAVDLLTVTVALAVGGGLVSWIRHREKKKSKEKDEAEIRESEAEDERERLWEEEGGRLSSPQNQILIGVRTDSARLAVRALFERDDIHAVRVGARVAAHRVENFNHLAARLGARAAILVDESVITSEVRARLTGFVNQKDFETVPLLSQIMSGDLKIEQLSPQQRIAVATLVVSLLPRIVPKDVMELQNGVVSVENLEAGVREAKFGIFHDFSNLPSTFHLPPSASKAVVWTLKNIVDDPDFFKVLENRRQKVNGKIVIDDFVVVDSHAKLDEILGDRYELFKENFPPNRIIPTEGPASSLRLIYEAMGASYKEENILFVDQQNGQTLGVQSQEDQAFRILLTEDSNILVADTFAVYYLAHAGDWNSTIAVLPSFIKVRLAGEGSRFIMLKKLEPADYEREIAARLAADASLTRAA